MTDKKDNKEKPPLSMQQFVKTQNEKDSLELLAAMNSLRQSLPDIMAFKYEQYLEARKACFNEKQAIELVKGIGL